MNILAAFNSFLPLLSIVLSIGLIIGGIVASKSQYSKVISQTQEQAITTWQSLNAAQAVKIEGLEKELAKMKQALKTVQFVLKKQGYIIEINEDFVTLTDTSNKSYSVPIDTHNGVV